MNATATLNPRRFRPGFWTGVFVEDWNGHRWSVVRAPNEPQRIGSAAEFSGGTCVSTTFCVASGGYEIANGVWRPLIERWNGSTWRIVALSDLPKTFQHGTGFRLTQVDCVSAHHCVAFGDPGFDGRGVNALRWDGRSWTYVATGSRATPALASRILACRERRGCPGRGCRG